MANWGMKIEINTRIIHASIHTIIPPPERFLTNYIKLETTAQRCKTCGRNLVKLRGSQYEMCPVCQTVNLFNRKLKDRIISRFGQYVNEVSSKDNLQGQNSQTLPPSQVVLPPSVNVNIGIQNFPQPHLPQSRIHLNSPQVHGRKRAVLCGVTYNGHKKKLEASVHNVTSMRKLLVNKLGFPYASILILTEEESDRTRIPTKRNIELALRWLVQGCQYGDSLMFYYAGHGSRVRDVNGDEIDGYDEALCPVDYRQAGMIIDDDINTTIVAPLPPGVTLHSVIDTCFSGTVLDLPFLCKINQEGLYMWEEHQLTNKGTNGGKAICISACADHQNSADTSAFTGNAIGALTFSFVQAMETENKLTYGKLLNAMRKKVYQAQQVVGRFAPFASSNSQEPQLSCSMRFELYSEPVAL